MAASQTIERAERLKRLPPYLFVEIDRAKQAAVDAGRDVIDLGIGDPDLPTPTHIVERMQTAVTHAEHHRYPSNWGLAKTRQTIAAWYQQRFGVDLDPDHEILPLIGSKEGIAHLPLALVNPGEQVLVSDPGYPPYANGTILAGGEPISLPLEASRDFWPDFDQVTDAQARGAKLCFLNYPNNPTAAVADLDQLGAAVEWARDRDIVVCHDAAYSEVAFDEYVAPSVLQVPGAMETAVEFHSLSKTYHMTGWRCGWVAGHADVVSALATVKSNIDSGIFQAVQEAAWAALTEPAEALAERLGVYQQRRDVLVGGLNELGWDVPSPRGTFYVWAALPAQQAEQGAAAFAKRALEDINVVLTPGVGFGAHGEGYVRMALTVSEERLAEVVDRFKGWL